MEDDRSAQSRQSELVRREREATQAVKKLEADLFSERADHARQVRRTGKRVHIAIYDLWNWYYLKLPVVKK